jgi:UDP-glucuronate 4-epimerase
LGQEPKIQKLAIQPGDVSITFADITRAKNEISYQPKVNIEQGIARYVDWFKANKLHD